MHWLRRLCFGLAVSPALFQKKCGTEGSSNPVLVCMNHLLCFCFLLVTEEALGKRWLNGSKGQAMWLWKLRAIMSGRDEYCKEQPISQLFTWGRWTISQEPIWVQVALNGESPRGVCQNGGDRNKAEGLAEEGLPYCALLVQCKWIVAVFLVYFCKITYCNYLFKEITIRASKGMPRCHCALPDLLAAQVLSKPGMATWSWSCRITQCTQQSFCWLCRTASGTAPSKWHRQMIPDLLCQTVMN